MSELKERLTEAGYYCGEYLTLKLAGDEPPTGWRRSIFRFPVTLYDLGFENLVSARILLLHTVGRRSGKDRVTPLEYLHDEDTDTFYLMAGWGGRTDWIRNIKADPSVRIQVGRRELARSARLLDPGEGGVVMRRWIDRTPMVASILEKDTGIRYDGTLDSATELARHYAIVALPVPTSDLHRSIDDQ